MRIYSRNIIVSLLLFSLPLYLVKVSVFGVPFNIYDLVLYILFVVAFLTQWSDVRADVVGSLFQSQVGRAFVCIYGLYVLGSLLGVMIAPNIWDALGVFRAYVINPFLAVLVVLLCTRSVRDLLYVAYGYVFSAIGAAAYVVFNLLTGTVGILDRSGSFFDAPNYLALYLAPSMLTTYFLTRIGVGGYTRWWLYVALLLQLAALLMTGSRGGILVVVLLGAGVLIWHIQGTLWRRIATALLLPIILIGMYVSSIVIPSRAAQSDSIRVAIMQESYAIVSDYPLLGAGLGNFQEIFSQRTQDRINFPEYITPHARTPHNLWLNAWAQSGVLGLLSMVLVFVYMFTWPRIGTAGCDTSRLAVAMFAVMYVVYGAFEAATWKNDLMVVFWIVALLPVVLTHIEQSKRRS